MCLALAWGWLGHKNAAIGRQKRKCGQGIALAATGTPCGTRARNLRIRSPTPCPLGQGGLCLPESHVATRFWLVLAFQAAQATLVCDEGLSCGAGGAPSRLLAAISSASEVIRADNNDPPRTRTWNLRLRRPTPYPLGQRAYWLWSIRRPQAKQSSTCLVMHGVGKARRLKLRRSNAEHQTRISPHWGLNPGPASYKIDMPNKNQPPLGIEPRTFSLQD